MSFSIVSNVLFTTFVLLVLVFIADYLVGDKNIILKENLYKFVRYIIVAMFVTFILMVVTLVWT